MLEMQAFSLSVLLLPSKTKQSYMHSKTTLISHWIFSSPHKTLLYLSTVFVFMFPTFISRLLSSGWASDTVPLWKYYAQNILQQHMSKEYSVQWIHQLPHSVPYTLLNAALNHTGLFGSHTTLLTHSELVPTIIPKWFLNTLTHVFLNLHFNSYYFIQM